MNKSSLLLLMVLSSCSSNTDNQDPHAEFNRSAHEFNIKLDDNILEPVSSFYNAALSDQVKTSVSNFLVNWKEPFYSINYLVSGNFEHAANSVFRFVINSTFGILGLVDIGEQIGLEKSTTTYNDTLTKMNVPTGDYIVLPLFGPSSTRDAIAEPISWFADPVGYFIGFPYMLSKAVVGVISDRANNASFIDNMKKNSLDLYSTMKSAYIQKHSSCVENSDSSIDDGPSPYDE